MNSKQKSAWYAQYFTIQIKHPGDLTIVSCSLCSWRVQLLPVRMNAMARAAKRWKTGADHVRAAHAEKAPAIVKAEAAGVKP